MDYEKMEELFLNFKEAYWDYARSLSDKDFVRAEKAEEELLSALSSQVSNPL